MKLQNSLYKDLFIKKGSHLSYNAGKYILKNMAGIIWITWPGSGDIILYEGNEISVDTEGILCATALSDSYISIKNGRSTEGLSSGLYAIVLRILNVISAEFSGSRISVRGKEKVKTLF